MAFERAAQLLDLAVRLGAPARVRIRPQVVARLACELADCAQNGRLSECSEFCTFASRFFAMQSLLRRKWIADLPQVFSIPTPASSGWHFTHMR